jgi:hypothetical protein
MSGIISDEGCILNYAMFHLQAHAIQLSLQFIPHRPVFTHLYQLLSEKSRPLSNQVFFQEIWGNLRKDILSAITFCSPSGQKLNQKCFATASLVPDKIGHANAVARAFSS